jgi:hypothetical protein
MSSIPPLKVLQARAEARAILFWEQAFDLATAIKPLLQYALSTNIIESYGAAATYALIHAAFHLPGEGPSADDPRLQRWPP